MGEIITDKMMDIIIDPLRRNWRSFLGLICGILLIIIGYLGLKWAYPHLVIPILSGLWAIFWYFKSGRIIMPVSKYTIIFCIKTDENSSRHYEKVFKELQNKIDNFNLAKGIRLINISSDIINNKTQAEKYRENYGVDLIVWGDCFSETQNGKEIVAFSLNYTCRINKSLRAKLTLFKLDLLLVAGTRDWSIKLDNTLFEKKKVVDNFLEACLFIIGIYLLTDNKLRDAIKLLNSLKQMIAYMKPDPFKKFIQGRINSLIVETYLLLGSVENEKKSYRLAKRCFLELEKYLPRNFRILAGLARLEYLTGSLDKAIQYTVKAAKIKRHHPIIYLNIAFFRLLEKKYNRVLFWYKKTLSLSTVDVNISGLLEFLNDRYNENKKEIGYIFALGIINYKFYDRKKGLADLLDFTRKAKNKNQYYSMSNYAHELIEAEEYRVKRISKKRGGRKKRGKGR